MSKDRLRDKIWRLLEEKNIADFPRPCFGRIPNFVGSRQASERIREISEFGPAGCVFCAPDFVLKHLREIILEEGKILSVALPHMVDFVQIDEREKIPEATTIRGFKRFGRPLNTKVDLLVLGSVAVDRSGNRLGKGRGYGDKEWSYLLNRGLIDSTVKVVTLVHKLQIVDDFSHLIGPEDKRVDYILTVDRIIDCKNQSRGHLR